MIQKIYNRDRERIESIYESIKMMESFIAFEYSIEKHRWSFSDLKKAKNTKIFFDLTSFSEQKFLYAIWLKQLKRRMIDALNIIEKELNVNKNTVKSDFANNYHFGNSSLYLP